jgi:hypothetical protein
VVASVAEAEKPSRKPGRWVSPLVGDRIARRIRRTLGRQRARRPGERVAAMIASCAARASAQREGAAARIPSGISVVGIDAHYLQRLSFSLGILRSVRLAILGLRDDDYPLDRILRDVDSGASRAGIQALQLLEPGGEFEEGAFFFRRLFPLPGMHSVPIYNDQCRYTHGVDLQSPVPFSADFPYFDPQDIDRNNVLLMEDDIVALGFISMPTASDFSPGGRFGNDKKLETSDMTSEELAILAKLADLTTTAVALGKLALLGWNKDARKTIDEMACYDADHTIARQDSEDENDPGVELLYKAVGPREDGG